MPMTDTIEKTDAETDLWTIEELLWTGATDAFRKRLAPGCLMAFPGMGLMQGEAIMESLKAAPRWSRVEMRDKRLQETGDCAVLAYHAHGTRDGDAPYEALCTSTWIRREDEWKLIQHQQCMG